MIKPTIGRVMWFWTGGFSPSLGFKIEDTEQPCTALVTFVWNEACVNLAVFDHNGNLHAVSSVPIKTDEHQAPPGHYCEWMPYQKGQAAKTEQLERSLHSIPPGAL